MNIATKMNVVLTQWNKFGDHALITDETSSEFEESKNDG
jgi:hypothetical protein